MFVVFKVVTEDLDQLDNIEKAIKEIKSAVAELKDVKRIPIGFGIEIIKVGFIAQEKDDKVVPELTEKLQKISHVTEVEMESMNLL